MMDSTMVTLFRDLKHGKRLKALDPQAGDKRETMPVILPRTRPKYDRQRGTTTYPQVEVAQRLLCTSTPPPSLQSQSLPRIRLHGNANRQQPRHSDSHIVHRRRTDHSCGSVAPSMKQRTTQSLPSLPYSDFGRPRPGGNKMKKNPQRSSTFDLFKTSSRHGYGTARANRNFAWDFGHKKTETHILQKDKGLPKTAGPEPNPRPVHLYMCVEMMDKFLEKRKGLRSDDTLNELIGLPTTQKRVSERQAKKMPREDRQLMKCKKMKDAETEEGKKHAPPLDAMASQEQVSQDCLQDNRMEAEPSFQQDDAASDEENIQGNKLENEFEDNEMDEELGLLVEEEDSEVFDACEGDEEDDEEDDGELDEEDGREIEEESDEDQAEDDEGNDGESIEDDNEGEDEDDKDNEEAADGSEAENIDEDDDNLEDDEAGVDEDDDQDKVDEEDDDDDDDDDGDDNDEGQAEEGNGENDEQDEEPDLEESDEEDYDKINNDDDDEASSEEENDSNEEEPG